MVSVGETLWICFSWTNIQWAHTQWQVLCWGPEFQWQQGPWPHRAQFTLGGCLLSLWWLQCPKITSHSSLWLKHGWFQSQAPAHCPHLSLSCWYTDTTLIQKKPSGEDQHQQRHSWINTQNKALLVNCALAHGSKPSEWGLLSISAIKAYLPHTRPWSAPSEWKIKLLRLQETIYRPHGLSTWLRGFLQQIWKAPITKEKSTIFFLKLRTIHQKAAERE